MIEGGKDDDGDDDSLLSKLNPFKAVKKAQQKAELQRRKEDANKVINDDMRKQLCNSRCVQQGSVSQDIVWRPQLDCPVSEFDLEKD